jgi:manganese transport protein
MPHNLYLHSALVQSRKLQKDEGSIRAAIHFNTIDSTSPDIAFFVNAAILVLAAMVFYGKTSLVGAGGQSVPFDANTDWIRVAYLTLAPLLARSRQPAVCHRAAGQRASQHHHRHAGRAGGDGRLHALAIAPWLRRMITRTLAIIPGVLIIGIRGDSSVNDLST